MHSVAINQTLTNKRNDLKNSLINNIVTAENNSPESFDHEMTKLYELGIFIEVSKFIIHSIFFPLLSYTHAFIICRRKISRGKYINRQRKNEIVIRSKTVEK